LLLLLLQYGPVQRPEQPHVVVQRSVGSAGTPEESDAASLLRRVHVHPSVGGRRQHRTPTGASAARGRCRGGTRRAARLHEEMVPHGPRDRHVPQQRHSAGLPIHAKTFFTFLKRFFYFPDVFYFLEKTSAKFREASTLTRSTFKITATKWTYDFSVACRMT